MVLFILKLSISSRKIIQVDFLLIFSSDVIIDILILEIIDTPPHTHTKMILLQHTRWHCSSIFLTEWCYFCQMLVSDQDQKTWPRVISKYFRSFHLLYFSWLSFLSCCTVWTPQSWIYINAFRRKSICCSWYKMFGMSSVTCYSKLIHKQTHSGTQFGELGCWQQVFQFCFCVNSLCWCWHTSTDLLQGALVMKTICDKRLIKWTVLKSFTNWFLKRLMLFIMDQSIDLCNHAHIAGLIFSCSSVQLYLFFYQVKCGSNFGKHFRGFCPNPAAEKEHLSLSDMNERFSFRLGVLV